MALWTPADITTALWLDADDSSTITLDGSSNVEQWDDKSGNDRNFAQGESDFRPLPIDDELNNKSIVRFDGTNDRLTCSDFLSSAPFISCFAVVKDRITSNHQLARFFSVDKNTAGMFTCGKRDNGNYFVGGRRLLDDAFTQINASQTNDFVIYEGYADYQNTNLFLRINGSTVASNTSFQTSGNLDSSLDNIGIGAMLDGTFPGPYDIAEMVVFSSAVSDSDRQNLEGYLAHKWGLEANLPNDHPYRHFAPGAIDPFEAAAALHGDPWLARVVAGHFALEADLEADFLLGTVLEAGRFALTGQLHDASFMTFTYLDAGHFQLCSDLIGGDVYMPDYIKATMPMLAGDLHAIRSGVRIEGELPALSGTMHTGAGIEADMPMFSGELDASAERAGRIIASFKAFTGEMYCGAHILANMPFFTGAMQGKVQVKGDMSAAMPMFTGDMDGLVDPVPSIEFTLKAFTGSLTVSQDTRATIAARMPSLTGLLDVEVPMVAFIAADMPMLSGSIKADRTIEHAIIATMPMFNGSIFAEVPQQWGVLRYEKGLHR